MNKIVGFVAGVKIDNEMWCVSRILNGLYRLNILTGKVDYICELPEKNEFERQAYTDILYSDNKLYFIPAFAKNIAIYDLKCEKISQINVSKYFLGSENEFNVGGGCIYNEWIYLYPCMSSILIRVNVKTLKIEIDDSFINDNKLRIDIFAYHKRHYQKDNELYIALASYDGVLCIDMENFTFKIISVPNNGTGYSSVIRLEDELWMAPHKEGDIVKYNIKNKRIERFGEYPSDFKRNKGLAFTCFASFNGNNIFLLPFAANMIVKIDRQNGKMEELKIKFSEPWLLAVMDDITSINIQSADMYDGEYYLMSEALNRMLVLKPNGKIDEVQFEFSNNEYKTDYAICIKESRGFMLGDFLQCI